MRDPQWMNGDPVALGTDVDEEEEKDDFWDKVDDAYDDYAEK